MTDINEKAVRRNISKLSSNLADYVQKVLPPSRERSIAHTKIQEAQMWLEQAPVSGE